MTKIHNFRRKQEIPSKKKKQEINFYASMV